MLMRMKKNIKPKINNTQDITKIHFVMKWIFCFKLGHIQNNSFLCVSYHTIE